MDVVIEGLGGDSGHTLNFFLIMADKMVDCLINRREPVRKYLVFDKSDKISCLIELGVVGNFMILASFEIGSRSRKLSMFFKLRISYSDRSIFNDVIYVGNRSTDSSGEIRNKSSPAGIAFSLVYGIKSDNGINDIFIMT